MILWLWGYIAVDSGTQQLTLASGWLVAYTVSLYLHNLVAYAAMHYRLPDSRTRTIEIVRDARALLWLCLTQHDMLLADYLAELHCHLSPLSGFSVHQTPLRHKIVHRDPCPFAWIIPFAFTKSCCVILGTAESVKKKVFFLKR
jgi:hypothetical protein